MCAYFPKFIPYFIPYNLNNKECSGFVDESHGIANKEGFYFFFEGEYIATTTISLTLLNDDSTKEYNTAKNKLNKMLNKLYEAQNHNKLFLGFLFNRIAPNWCSTTNSLISVYPK